MNPVRHASLALILCTLLPFSANAVDVATLPPGRAASLFNSFEVICNVGTPNFEHLTALAAAMRMKVLEDRSETAPGADTLQRKGWFGMLTTGSFAFWTQMTELHGTGRYFLQYLVVALLPDRPVWVDRSHYQAASVNDR
jgi:hypothetical protein